MKAYRYFKKDYNKEKNILFQVRIWVYSERLFWLSLNFLENHRLAASARSQKFSFFKNDFEFITKNWKMVPPTCKFFCISSYNRSVFPQKDLNICESRRWPNFERWRSERTLLMSKLFWRWKLVFPRIISQKIIHRILNIFNSKWLSGFLRIEFVRVNVMQ